MNTKEITEIRENVRTIRGHFDAAKDREAPVWFLSKLRGRLRKELERMHPMTSKVRKSVATGLVCVVMAVSGCGAIHGVGSDLQGGSKAGAKWFRTYGENFEQEYYPAPRMIN